MPTGKDRNAENNARVYAYDTALTRAVEAVNGFVYQGDRLNAIVDLLAYLREHPEDADRLLDTDSYQAWKDMPVGELEALRG